VEEEISDSIGYFWRIYYWANFIMLWFVVPFTEYFILTPKRSLWYRCLISLRCYLTDYFIMLLIGLGAILGMIMGGMVTWGNLFPFIITASNFYGMLWVICSLGYGLVKYPKSYFDTCDLDVMKRYTLHKMGCSRNQLEKGV
jgi:ribose/xylose/arabinose/galactoside ABC-type transport system permease subunit